MQAAALLPQAEAVVGRIPRAEAALSGGARRPIPGRGRLYLSYLYCRSGPVYRCKVSGGSRVFLHVIITRGGRGGPEGRSQNHANE